MADGLGPAQRIRATESSRVDGVVMWGMNFEDDVGVRGLADGWLRVRGGCRHGWVRPNLADSSPLGAAGG